MFALSVSTLVYPPDYFLGSHIVNLRDYGRDELAKRSWTMDM